MNMKIDRLKSKIISKDLILNGSVIEQYKQCGKPNCRCHKGRGYWHGPYWVWTRKEEGKTITKNLSSEQARLVKKAIKEMHDLQKTIAQWRTWSLKKIERND